MTEYSESLVLIHREGKPMCYARVDAMNMDGRPGYNGWYQVDLLLLTFPATKVTWGLNYKQVYESEPFTMGGVDMLFEYIPSVLVAGTEYDEVNENPLPESRSNVVSLADRRK